MVITEGGMHGEVGGGNAKAGLWTVNGRRIFYFISNFL